MKSSELVLKFQKEIALRLIQARYPDFDPLFEIANITHETQDERLRFDCSRVLAEYFYRKEKDESLGFNDKQTIIINYDQPRQHQLTHEPETPELVEKVKNKRKKQKGIEQTSQYEKISQYGNRNQLCIDTDLTEVSRVE